MLYLSTSTAFAPIFVLNKKCVGVACSKPYRQRLGGAIYISAILFVLSHFLINNFNALLCLWRLKSCRNVGWVRRVRICTHGYVLNCVFGFKVKSIAPLQNLDNYFLAFFLASACVPKHSSSLSLSESEETYKFTINIIVPSLCASFLSWKLLDILVFLDWGC